MRGRKPKPTAVRRRDGNPGKRGFNHAEPVPPEGLPDCPEHLSEAAREEWHRLAGPLHAMGVVTLADRGALAAYCQAWGRWVAKYGYEVREAFPSAWPARGMRASTEDVEAALGTFCFDTATPIVAMPPAISGPVDMWISGFP